MADVTISNLAASTPVGTGVIPYSDGSTTTKVTVSQINALAGGVLAGTVIMWPINTPPAGYLECNGGTVSRVTYAALYGVIGTTYGAGDGSTTFALPDYRGRFLRGWDHGAAVDPDRATRTNRGDGTTGDNTGTKQADALQNITGAYFGESRGNASGAFADVYGGDGGYSGAGSQPTHWNFDASRVARTSTETRPTNINIVFCIKT